MDGVSRLPDIEGDKSKRERFKQHPIRVFNRDIVDTSKRSQPFGVVAMNAR